MGKRKWKYLPVEVRRKVIRLAARGRSLREIADELDVAISVVWRGVQSCGGVFRPEQWSTSSARLSLEDRVTIKLGLEAGRTFTSIAGELERSVSTVSREVNNHGGRHGYRPVTAHRAACDAARRPKPTKLASSVALCARVVADLERLWSPQQIARRLRDEFPDDPERWVSHETIYKSLY